MATLLKYRESQQKAASLLSTSSSSSDAKPLLPTSELVPNGKAHSPVNVTRRFSSLEVLPRPAPEKRNVIGQQKHTVEIRSGGVIAFRVPLYQKMLVGGISGVIGLSTVFPVDLIKTRLQIGSNVGLTSVCRDVFAKYGIGGFYRGLGTTAIMVFPEKACKLGVNDYLRDVFCDYDRNKETIPQQVMAGALTGVVQVDVTNPMEIMKIRLQTAESAAVSPLQALRELGWKGLYKGSGVTLLRDVPYNVIFFLSYIEIKRALTSPDGEVYRSRILGSGVAAGMLAAFAGTPMDVVKSRIQMRNSPYTNGAADCAKRLYAEGGYGMFFRGALSRMAVQSPLYGIALLFFELQSQYLSS